MEFQQENIDFYKANRHGAEIDTKLQNIANRGNERDFGKCAEQVGITGNE